MQISDFHASDWIKNWAGQWSFLTCVYWGERYTKDYIIEGKVFWPKCIFFFENGTSAHFVRQHDRDVFGKNLATEWVRHEEHAHTIFAELRQRTDEILEFISAYESVPMDKNVFDLFWEKQDAYYKPHIQIKFVTDYLPSEILEKMLPDLEAARVYAEPVATRTEEFMRVFAEQIGVRHDYASHLILCLTRQELESYFLNQDLPQREILEKRYQKSAMLFMGGAGSIFVGDEVEKIEQLVIVVHEDGILRGMTAFGGKARGTVRVILDPTKLYDFHEGDILVAGMTRPEYLPYVRKAAAVVTDAGGVLSHAAIVARELKKPCVIGTKFATKVLKDGDVVEVDAETGIIKIIS